VLSSSAGEKIFARCFAKIFTFSWSVLAQVLSGFIIGGVAMVSLLNSFVAFYSDSSSGDIFVI
jgi:hypothetical protein